MFPGPEKEIPESYPRLLDPYVALSFVAAQTPMKIGTCTTLPAEHDPIALAKALATLDYLSDGRLVVGVGYGWNRNELANHGYAWKDRREVVREHVEVMQALWTETEAEYHGTHVNLEPSWCWPKPVQERLPVLLGVAGLEKGLEAIVQWGDGWMPGGPTEWITDRLGELRRRWEQAGRDDAGPIVWAIQEIADDDGFRRQLDALQAAGVGEVLVSFETSDLDEILPVLDRYAAVLETSFA
jgi:probable F420-dependent oxidoreductase